ncbi:shikimate dehydrogenase [Gordonia polyisoprenivorans]|uniref:shikimate dehydrogenase n=1 Tax=unclassified Gordonia (in: high G+C Gram-positive bacteria) TaxID=2657482 RepID=UPI000363C6DE|nr:MULTISPECIES: shikimate dehydrogenase [Gordonia]MBE7193801.1 shikimate dehydrogenase [Gordonia polyisoprenivorans]MDF3281733.1 shikimate dehydrogenase [Gordonia sp. N1V]OPX15517.1 shikimate dehydrogenase [Gordonia sp. i37]QUD85650.1 shikimate dehydrogenase [Gordonia polyisoprenivorans]UZF59086.1 shikimate dehydrogenase [Gordonia polyisoprenivorans]
MPVTGPLDEAGSVLARPPLCAPVGGRTARRATVLGSPVSHSRSPDLHLAAYRALGLEDWTYTRRECTAADLPGVVAAAPAEQIGFSVTMPNKLAALAVADERTERAVLVGSANTLVRTVTGWRADCTDIDGMTGALEHLGVAANVVGGDLPDSAVLVGAGGTALPSVAALAAVGIGELTVVARSAQRAADVLTLARDLGMSVQVADFASTDDLSRRCRDAAVAVSTVPASATTPVIDAVSGSARLVDVIYDPWPTPLATAVRAAGGRVAGGLVMLLNQAFSQVEQFTGLPAPRTVMAEVFAGADAAS